MPHDLRKLTRKPTRLSDRETRRRFDARKPLRVPAGRNLYQVLPIKSHPQYKFGALSTVLYLGLKVRAGDKWLPSASPTKVLREIES
jgi:hypothetical protein